MPEGDELLEAHPAFTKIDDDDGPTEITLPGRLLTGEHAEDEAKVAELIEAGWPEPAARERVAVERGDLPAGGE